MSLVKWVVGLGVVALVAKVGTDIKKSVKPGKGPQPVKVFNKPLGMLTTENSAVEKSVTYAWGAAAKVEAVVTPAADPSAAS